MSYLQLLSVFTFVLVSFRMASAEEKYPTQLPNRLFGRDQMNVGSCAADAEIDALEQQFANAGLPIALSAFHRHAKIWMPKDATSESGPGLRYSKADRDVLDATGDLLPDYMWPEDGSLVGDSSNLGPTRPSISEQAVIDPAYSANADGFSRTYLTFAPGFSNHSSVQALRDYVKAGAAVTVAVSPDILYLHDHVTGLLKKPYALSREDLLKSEVRHAVSVVGFDDSIAAFIVRNSWNDSTKIRAIVQSDIETLKPDLDRMKNKIAPYPLAGYYEIPYAYLNDLAAQGKGSFHVLKLNQHEFAKKYFEFKKHYTVLTVPYSCDRNRVIEFLDAYEVLKNGIEHSGSASKQIKTYRARLLALLQAQVQIQSRLFNFAKFAFNNRLPGIDRIADFYSGKFHDYYCHGQPRENFFPQPQDFPVALNARTQLPWFLKLSDSQTLTSNWEEAFSWMVRERQFPEAGL